MSKRDGAVARHVFFQIIVIQALQRTGRNQVERIVGITADCKFGVNTAVGVQRMTKPDAADLLRQAIGNKVVEKCLGSRT